MVGTVAVIQISVCASNIVLLNRIICKESVDGLLILYFIVLASNKGVHSYPTDNIQDKTTADDQVGQWGSTEWN